ncbi:DUF6286 domain-containing protein [uncultured Jatrophihabitans sp.]|uniref:DUF6286 domain-containing protein n=1 Tax=uncultured Jatrophihabitans sp. TaxID=1610747 RepID=UPI0035C98263
MRLLNRLLGALLGLAVIVVGVLLIIEVVADRTTHHAEVVKWHGAYHWAGHTSWTQGSVRVGCIIAAVVGLLLLILELKRGRVTRFRVAAKGDEQPVDAAYTRRGVAGAVRAAVIDVDGVKSAKVGVGRRSVRVRAVTSARDTESAGALAAPSQAAAQSRLDALELAHAPRLKLTATPRKR